MRTAVLIVTMLLTTFAQTLSAQHVGVAKSKASSDGVAELSIEYVMPGGDVYEREPFPIFVILKSSMPDIASADVVKDFELEKGNFATLQTIDNPGNAYTARDGKKTYYYFPLRAYMATIADKGIYKLKGGEYSIGTAYSVIVNDPFWGPVRSQQIKESTVAATDAKIKVKSLPPVASGTNFSGSVGDFTIETIVPKGDIFVNEEATAYVVLRGHGMIESATLPEYRGAFVKGMKLKSVTESRDEHFDANTNEMVSEIHLECTFVPSERENVEIGEITFGYFDPAARQYKTVRSKPVKITVKSTASKHESISI